MRKYGKYEKRPEAAPIKQPKAKSALLQTYFTSLICLVLCVTMFFGTSYAWFTSEVNNVGNEISIGILKVDLDKQLKDGTWGSLADKVNGVNQYFLFDSNARWEPGYTSLETIRVVNQGDLAFKYTLNFTDGTITEGGNLAEVAENFEVWVFNHYQKTYEKPASYEAMVANTDWKKIGTLAEVLAGKAVLEDKNMRTVRVQDLEEGETTPTIPGTDGVATTDTYTIALHMKKEASDATLMGKKITLNVKLVAYQMAKETDGFGSAAYDEAKYVTTAVDLQNALDSATGNTLIRFANDIDGDVTVIQKADVKITIDGDGHKLDGFITVDGKSAHYETTGLTIKNVVFTGVSGVNTGYICLGREADSNARYTNNVTVKDCTFEGIDEGDNRQTAAVRSFTGGDWNLTIDGCTIDNKMHSMLQAANIEKGLKITNCRVYSKNGANLNHTNSLEMSGCTFDVEGYAVRFGVNNSNVINTEEKVFAITDSTLKSACNGIDDAVIIFRDSSKYATLTLTNTTIDGSVKVAGILEGKTIINGLN